MKTTLIIIALLVTEICTGQSSSFEHINFAYESITNPNALAMADFDGDGKKDVLVGSYTDDKLMWFKNLGDMKFSRAMIISTSVNAVNGVKAADIDGDGDIDALSASGNDDRIGWFANDGTGNFGTEQIISNQVDFASDLYSVDIDGDSDIDVLSTSASDGLVLLHKNLGGGFFAPQDTLYHISGWASRVITFDVDNDGDQDVVSTYANENTAWYENLGNAVFGPAQALPGLSGSNELKSGDLNNDGYTDIVISRGPGASDTIYWYENLGTGNFAQKVAINVSSDLGRYFDVMDMNNDGTLDIVSGNESGYNLWLSSNSGGGIFNAPTSVNPWTFQQRDVVCTDLDGDGKNEIIVACWGGVSKVAIHKNLGNNLFGNQLNLTGNGGYTSVHSNDVNGDGLKDIMVTGVFDIYGVTWHENYGNGLFGPQRLVDGYANGAKCIQSKDVDNDGNVDLIVACQDLDKVILYKGLGENEFDSAFVINNAIPDPTSLDIKDLDNDGDLDIAVCAYTGGVYWLENTGGGVYSPEQFIGSSSVCEEISCDDLDNDGLLDITVKGKWFKNLGNGSFSAEMDNAGGSNFVLVDIDNNGFKDMVVASNGVNGIGVRYNVSGVFTTGASLFNDPFYLITKIDTLDFNNDGYMDIVGTDSQYDKIVWLENVNGTSLTVFQEISTTPYAAGGLCVSDLDNDGDIDVVAILSGLALSWFQNGEIYPRQLKGRIYVDLNNNQQNDSTDIGAALTGISSTPLSDFTYTFPNGNYILNLSDVPGTYILEPNLPQYWSVSTDSLTYTIVLDTSYLQVDNLDFGITPDTMIYDLNASLTGAHPRCETVVNYWVNLENTGTTILNGTIQLQLDDSLGYVGANVMPDSIVGQNIYWSYDSLLYFSDTMINLQVQMPVVNGIDDSITSFLIINTLDSIGSVITFTDSLSQKVTCPYDPNDKISRPYGIDSMGYIDPSTSNLEYTIRFQNTGSDTAINVVILDQLDANLDWSSLTPIASSFPVQIDVDQYGEVTFSFNNIYLPDSTTNEISSHGFVRFKIDIIPGLPMFTSIYNTGFIYFDNNPAVLTNTKINTLYACVPSIEVMDILTICLGDSVLIFNDYESFGGIYYDTLQTVLGCDSIQMIEIDLYPETTVSFGILLDDTVCINHQIITLTQGSPSGGIYSGSGVLNSEFDPIMAGIGSHTLSYTYNDINGCANIDQIQIVVTGCAGLDQSVWDLIEVYPNPTNEKLFIDFGENNTESESVEVINILGMKVMELNVSDSSIMVIPVKYLSGGSYFINIKDASGIIQFRTRVIVNH